jgi:hypothetical protein
MHRRLRQAERARDLRDAAGPRLLVQVEEQVDRAVDGLEEQLHGGLGFVPRYGTAYLRTERC